jgi:mannose-1-phosphate guanylyltransferase
MIPHALVLTAGLGTRLRPITLTLAKPAVPVAGVPLVRRIIAWLAREGVTDVVLNLHYLPETIAAVVGDGSDMGVRVRYSWEQPAVLGSAGGPRHALPVIGARTFFILNGDTLTDLALAPVAESHARSGARVTIALMPNREPEKYGGVKMDEAGHVTGFVARGQQAAGSYHFFGVQVAEAGVFAGVKDGEVMNSFGATRGLYDALIAAQPGSIHGYLCNASFWDIGTPDDLARTDAEFRSVRL